MFSFHLQASEAPYKRNPSVTGVVEKIALLVMVRVFRIAFRCSYDAHASDTFVFKQGKKQRKRGKAW